jgi:hypothetical protein
VGRVIRSKSDYGMMIFADKRYQRHDKRSKLPNWIISQLKDAHMNLSTDMALHIAREVGCLSRFTLLFSFFSLVFFCSVRWI